MPKTGIPGTSLTDGQVLGSAHDLSPRISLTNGQVLGSAQPRIPDTPLTDGLTLGSTQRPELDSAEAHFHRIP